MRSFLVKTVPSALAIGEIAEFGERRLKGANPAQGDTMFVWTAEEKGGNGLVARGRVLQASSDHISVLITELWPTGLLSNENLAPHRDSTANPLLHGLARIYRYSHLQMVALTLPEATYLQGLVP